MKRYVLVTSKTPAGSVIIGLKTVPEFFQGSIEEYSYELSESTLSKGSVIAFQPKESGRVYVVASLQSGPLAFETFGDEKGVNSRDLIQAYKKL